MMQMARRAKASLFTIHNHTRKPGDDEFTDGLVIIHTQNSHLIRHWYVALAAGIEHMHGHLIIACPQGQWFGHAFQPIGKRFTNAVCTNIHKFKAYLL
jgi:hypothetical protein